MTAPAVNPSTNQRCTSAKRINVGTMVMTAAATTLTITTAVHAANAVSIAIQDTGGGIAPEHLPRIFEPFFTTKEKGIGLGMSIVHKIITAHGGTLDIASEEGVGTTVRVTLPRAQAPAAHAENPDRVDTTHIGCL